MRVVPGSGDGAAKSQASEWRFVQNRGVSYDELYASVLDLYRPYCFEQRYIESYQ